jgi:hypothetical protein
VAAALANLKFWSKHRRSLLANVATQGDSFRARLIEAQRLRIWMSIALGASIDRLPAVPRAFPEPTSQNCRLLPIPGFLIKMPA